MSISRVIVISTLVSIAANLAHPVTPTLIVSLNLPAYMFGVAFSSMALTNFLTSPFWGVTSDRWGRVEVMAATNAIYGVAQLLFGLSTQGWHIAAARMLAGFGTGGSAVATLAYLSEASPPEDRARHMTTYAALQMAGASLGFLIGGVLGTYKVFYPFALQSASLLLLSASYVLLLKNPLRERAPSFGSINPFRAMLETKRILTGPLAVFLCTCFLTSFAYVAFDNTFNYYIKDVFGFKSSYNGIIKAVIGVIGLTANFTINRWLAKHTDIRKSVVPAYCAAGVFILTASLMSSRALFFAFNMLFYTSYSLYYPMQQALLSRDTGTGSVGQAAGALNASRSLGMIFGPLMAGFLYVINIRLAFAIIAFAYVLAGVLAIANVRQYAGKTQATQ